MLKLDQLKNVIAIKYTYQLSNLQLAPPSIERCVQEAKTLKSGYNPRYYHVFMNLSVLKEDWEYDVLWAVFCVKVEQLKSLLTLLFLYGSAFNPLHFNINMHILYTLPYKLVLVLTRRNHLVIKASWVGDHFQ